jgi:hypothetical protein
MNDARGAGDDARRVVTGCTADASTDVGRSVDPLIIREHLSSLLQV